MLPVVAQIKLDQDVQPRNMTSNRPPDLSSRNTAVIIFAEDSECLLVAGLHVKVFRSFLHHGTKSLKKQCWGQCATVRWDTEKSDLEVDVATVAVNLVDDVRHLHVCGVVPRSPQAQLNKIGGIYIFFLHHKIGDLGNILKNVQLCSSWQPAVKWWIMD